MRQDKLSPALGSKKNRKRVGRGDGSGHGSYSGRGCKGQRPMLAAGLNLALKGGSYH